MPLRLNDFDPLDLMSTIGCIDTIEREPRCSGISNALFLYVGDLDGHRIEIYCPDCQTEETDLEPIVRDLKGPRRQTLWAALTPEIWLWEGSTFEGTEVQDAALAAQPNIAP